MKRITVAYHLPYPSTVYATKYIYHGFKNAFTHKGHNFITFTPDDDLKEFLERYKPDIFMTASHFVYRKYLDYDLLKRYREKGMRLITKVDYWNSPLLKSRVNEAPSMSNDRTVRDLIERGLLADHYYCPLEQGDGRMEGFATFAGQDFVTVPLAADGFTLSPSYDERFAADVSFIGTNLPQKRDVFKERLFPLREQYDFRLYGQDWTPGSRLLGMAAKAGQYFNVPVMRSIQKPKLEPVDEAHIYASSKILVNLHEDYQRSYGGDCNERTFKIPFCGGLEIVDDVSSVEKYFVPGKEIIVAKDSDDWFDKIRYYYDHADEARRIAKAGERRARRDHTYLNRIDTFVSLVT